MDKKTTPIWQKVFKEYLTYLLDSISKGIDSTNELIRFTVKEKESPPTQKD